MQHIFRALFALTVLSLSHGAVAQQADDDATERQIGEPYVTARYGDWAVQCITAPEGQQDECNLTQILVGQDGAPVAQMSIFALPPESEAAAGVRVVVPLETLLQEGLVIAVDQSQPRVYGFEFCNASGCVARFGFTQEELNAMRLGISAVVRIVPVRTPAQPVLLDLSLLGVADGLRALETLR